MGMFDYVIPECSIEGIENPSQYEWQTKSFDGPAMDRYRITADGRLLAEVYDVEDRSDPNAEGLMRFVGMCSRIHRGWRDTNYHGDLNFYTHIGRDYSEESWREFDARFTNGQLEWIRPATGGTDGR